MPHTMQTIWTWESRRNGFPHTGPLWLSPVLWSQELFEEIEDPAEAIRFFWMRRVGDRLGYSSVANLPPSRGAPRRPFPGRAACAACTWSAA